MGEPNSVAKFYIDYSGGNFQLRRVKSLKDDPERTLEIRKAVGVNGGAGFKRSEGGCGITLSVYRESPTPEVNYRRLEQTGELFTITTQDEDGGLREQYQKCRVEKVSRSTDDDGENIDEVTIKALRGPVLLPARVIPG